jgi:hypothetical protein
MEEELTRFEKDEAIGQPPRIVVHRSRGTVINALGDQLGMLDCWAHAGLPIRTSFRVRDGIKQIE